MGYRYYGMLDPEIPVQAWKVQDSHGLGTYPESAYTLVVENGSQEFIYSGDVSEAANDPSKAQSDQIPR